jgi:hypothetical protein
MSTTSYPLGHSDNDITRHFLCCLYNRTDTIEGCRKGLTPEEVYKKLDEGRALFPGPEGAARTQLINQLVHACERNRYIEWVGDTGRIKMIDAGMELCKKPGYCSKVPSYKD